MNVVSSYMSYACLGGYNWLCFHPPISSVQSRMNVMTWFHLTSLDKFCWKELCERIEIRARMSNAGKFDDLIPLEIKQAYPHLFSNCFLRLAHSLPSYYPERKGKKNCLSVCLLINMSQQQQDKHVFYEADHVIPLATTYVLGFDSAVPVVPYCANQPEKQPSA